MSHITQSFLGNQVYICIGLYVFMFLHGFSLAIAVPEYHKNYVKAVKTSVSPADGAASLSGNNASAVLVAAW